MRVQKRSQYLRKYMRELFNDSIRILVVNYSWKALHLRCLQDSWLRPKSLLANIISYAVHTFTEYKNIHTRYPASFHILCITKLLHIILLKFYDKKEDFCNISGTIIQTTSRWFILVFLKCWKNFLKK